MSDYGYDADVVAEAQRRFPSGPSRIVDYATGSNRVIFGDGAMWARANTPEPPMSDTGAVERAARALFVSPVSDHAAPTAPEIWALCEEAARAALAAAAPTVDPEHLGDLERAYARGLAAGIAKRPTVEQVAEVLAAHEHCGPETRGGASIAEHQAEQVVALWGAR